MSDRRVFKKGGSLYINIPNDVVLKSGIKEGQLVSVVFVWGLGIVVGKTGDDKKIMRMFDNCEPSMINEKKNKHG
jgi:antitoxin component of MazEF toxin-antitoxin module